MNFLTVPATVSLPSSKVTCIAMVCLYMCAWVRRTHSVEVWLNRWESDIEHIGQIFSCRITRYILRSVHNLSNVKDLVISEHV